MLPTNMAQPSRPGAARPGYLLIIGGAEEKLRQRQILSRFVSLAGGNEARVAIVSTASSLGDEATELYRSLFTQLGAAEVIGLRPITREEANDPALAAALRDVTGVFMTGGNQLRLSSVVGGTALGRMIVERHRHGAVVAGTSAGASAISSHMVAAERRPGCCGACAVVRARWRDRCRARGRGPDRCDPGRATRACRIVPRQPAGRGSAA